MMDRRVMNEQHAAYMRLLGAIVVQWMRDARRIDWEQQVLQEFLECDRATLIDLISQRSPARRLR